MAWHAILPRCMNDDVIFSLSLNRNIILAKNKKKTRLFIFSVVNYIMKCGYCSKLWFHAFLIVHIVSMSFGA